tara:strand:- start:1035 stop:1904 length:870 start_codon:yes stop_codon:yes gene_type:complete
MSLQFDLFSDYSCELGEGPFWDSKRSRLHWVDIIGKKIISQNLDGSNIHALEVDGNPGCVVLSDDGTMVAGVDNQISSLDGGGNLLKVLADTKEGSGLRFNDGKCDPSGRFWVGSMDRKEKNKLGSLYSWNSIEGLVNREQGVTVSNGMGWSPDNSLFYYIDSPTREVSVYDFDLSTGSINNKRRFISFSEEDGFPDGMTIDNEGRLWIAFWGGSKIMCVNPDSKAIEEVVSFPVSKITSCAFGGEKMDQLFITSAKVQVNEKDEPMAGKTFVVSLGVKGLPSFNLKLI